MDGRTNSRGAAKRLLGVLVASVLALSGCAVQPPPHPPQIPSQPPASTPSEPGTTSTPGSTPDATTPPPPPQRPSLIPTSWPPAAAGSAKGVTQHLVFGNPWSSSSKDAHAIADSLMNIINNTPRGGSLTFSILNMTYIHAADALIAAYRRGVQVRVVADYPWSQFKKLQQAIGKNQKAKSWAIIRGHGFREHSKFLLASTSGGKANVVWISSGNFSMLEDRSQANDVLITTGDKPLYSFLSKQFDLMSSGVVDPKKLGRSTTTPTAFVQTYPIENGGQGKDPTEDFLSNVTCVKDGQHTVIRMAHYIISVQRQYLVEQLRNLAAQGCDVRVVGDTASWGEVPRDTLAAPGPGHVALRTATGAILHTKIIVINGWDAAGNRMDVAMAGSHNLSGRGLTKSDTGVNDELSVFLWNPAIVKGYTDWVDMVIAKHSKPYVAKK